MSSDCLFCKIVRRDIAGDVVYEDDELLAFRDISPQAPVHVLVVPKRHVATVNDLEPGDSQLVGGLILRAQAIARAEGIDESGYRLVLNCNAEGGQTVYHVHLHLLGGRPLRSLG